MGWYGLVWDKELFGRRRFPIADVGLEVVTIFAKATLLLLLLLIVTGNGGEVCTLYILSHGRRCTLNLMNGT